MTGVDSARGEVPLRPGGIHEHDRELALGHDPPDRPGLQVNLRFADHTVALVDHVDLVPRMRGGHPAMEVVEPNGAPVETDQHVSGAEPRDEGRAARLDVSDPDPGLSGSGWYDASACREVSDMNHGVHRDSHPRFRLDASLRRRTGLLPDALGRRDGREEHRGPEKDSRAPEGGDHATHPRLSTSFPKRKRSTHSVGAPLVPRRRSPAFR